MSTLAGKTLQEIVLDFVAGERQAQDNKFGVDRRFPSFCTSNLAQRQLVYAVPSQEDAKAHMDSVAEDGLIDWAHILAEEYAEVFASEDDGNLLTELIQTAAVCVAWAEQLVAESIARLNDPRTLIPNPHAEAQGAGYSSDTSDTSAHKTLRRTAVNYLGPDYGMFTTEGDRLVDHFVGEAMTRNWPIGTTADMATEWVQEQVETHGKSNPWLAVEGDIRDVGETCIGDEVGDTDCRESITYEIERRMRIA